MFLVQANNKLAVSLHHIFAKEEGNVFFSPFSISTPVAMLICAAEDETVSEMRTALGYDRARIGKKVVAKHFEKLMAVLLQNSESYTLSCANVFLSQEGHRIKAGYKRVLVESFKALVLEVDFQRDNEKIVEQINVWVKEQTSDMIPEFIQSLDTDTVLVLLNAVYFKGAWLRPFPKEATSKRVFYNGGSEDNTKEVDMMRTEETFPFYEDETLQVLELAYVGEEVAMLLFLPRVRDGLKPVEASLTPSFVHELKEKLQKQKLEVFLPKFRLEYTKSLVPCFQSLGMKRVFRQAQLGGATDSPNIAVSDILHKAVLEVTEEGSEASACTDVVENALCLTSFPKFVCDHPFVFAIYDARRNLILFMGRVNEL